LTIQIIEIVLDTSYYVTRVLEAFFYFISLNIVLANELIYDFVRPVKAVSLINQ